MKYLSYLLIIFYTTSSLAAVDRLKPFRVQMDQKKYAQAAYGLFKVAFEQKRKYKEDEITQARLLLGISLYRLGYPQLAAFPLISISYKNNSKTSASALSLLVIISDELKDKTILNYSVSKLDLNQNNDIAKELILTKLAETYYDGGNINAAEDSYNSALQINQNNQVALYNLGLIGLKKNNPAAAYKYFERMYDINKDKSVLDKSRGLASISIARTLYQAKKWDDAIDFYRDIPKDHELYRKAQQELAWTLFRATKFRAALSTIETLQTPYYDNYFDPESLLLRTILLMFICQIEDLDSAVSTYETLYQPVLNDLTLWFKENHKPDDYLKLISDTNVNLRLIQNGYKLKNKTKIPFFVVRTGLESAKIKPQFELIKKIQRERKKFRKSAFAKNPVFSKFAERIYSNRVVSSQRILSQLFESYLKDTKTQIADYNAQFELMKYEALNTKKNYLKAQTLKTEGSSNTNVSKKRDFYTENGYRYWPFDGEYWIDEIGNYQFVGTNRCPDEE